MASIKQRGRSFQVQVRRKDSPSLSKCFKTLIEAKAWARQTEAVIDQGGSPIARIRNGEVPTFGETLKRYGLEVLPLKKGAAKELLFVRRWSQHKLASKPLSSISPHDIASYPPIPAPAAITSASTFATSEAAIVINVSDACMVTRPMRSEAV